MGQVNSGAKSSVSLSNGVLDGFVQAHNQVLSVGNRVISAEVGLSTEATSGQVALQAKVALAKNGTVVEDGLRAQVKVPTPLKALGQTVDVYFRTGTAAPIGDPKQALKSGIVDIGLTGTLRPLPGVKVPISEGIRLSLSNPSLVFSVGAATFNGTVSDKQIWSGFFVAAKVDLGVLANNLKVGRKR